MRLLDTDIMIDILRAWGPALEWLAALDEAPGLPGFVVMELMWGCKNHQEMVNLRKRVLPFLIYWPNDRDSNRAMETFSHGRLSHNLGILDALIGECAVGRNAVLCTFNVKHFNAVLSLTTEQPYEKNPNYPSSPSLKKSKGPTAEATGEEK